MLDRQVADLDRRLGTMARLRQELVDLGKAADRLSTEPACYCGLIEHRH